MKKQLLTVGDSFTYGDELDDIHQAWPYKLSDTIGYEVHNMGQSGCSNASILRRTLTELAMNRYDLVVVGWTSPGRVEWKDDVGTAYDVWPGYPISGKFLTDYPWRETLVEFISQHHCSEYLYQQYLIQVLSLQSYCKANNIELLMLDIISSNYYRTAGSNQHDKLEQQIDINQFVGFKQFGMRELTKDLPTGKGGHPLHQGHKRIANELTKYIRN